MNKDIDIDHILRTFNAQRVRFLLIGGMNFSLQHHPQSTFDVDLWIDDTEANRGACEQALAVLGAEWGRGDADWGPTSEKSPGWLASQGVFSLNSPYGPIDIFRTVKGLGDWEASFANAMAGGTAAGTEFYGLGDQDMLRCQLVLNAGEQKLDRIAFLKRKVGEANP